MLKDLMKCVREYKKASLQAPVLVSLEVVMECIIPFIISRLVNEIKAGCALSVIDGHPVPDIWNRSRKCLFHGLLRICKKSPQGHVL